MAPAFDIGGSRLDVATDEWQQHENADVLYVSKSYWIKALKFMWRRSADIDIVYVNSFFSWRHGILPIALLRLTRINIPVIVVAPRGELDEGALELKSRRKLLYLSLVKLLAIPTCVNWHATSPRERVQIRSVFGEGVRVYLSENKTLDLSASRTDAWQFDPALCRLAFLSRVSPKKGLDLLIRACEHLPDKVSLEVFGPIEDEAYWRLCVELAERSRTGRIQFRGPLEPSAVVTTLESFDAMVLPTAGENFGHVIAESLAAGCPVIATDRTPWTSALREGAGLVIEARNEVAITNAINNFLEMTSGERRAMRERASEAYQGWMARRRPTDMYELFDQLVDDRSDVKRRQMGPS